MTNRKASDAQDNARDIWEDLSGDDLLRLQPGERIYRLYCFRTTTDGPSLRHRIYTKLKFDGRLSLVTFAEQDVQRPEQTKRVRSNIARVADLSHDDLERLIRAVQNQAGSDSCEAIDLSDHASLDDQLAWLEQRAP